MTQPTVIKREKGCVTLSDGRRVVRMAWEFPRQDERGYRTLQVWDIREANGDAEDMRKFSTLREALKAAGVQS